MKITFYQGRNNKVQMTITEDDVPVNMALVTNVIVETAAGNFSLIDNPTVIVKLSTLIELRFGLSTLPVGIHHARVVVVTANEPDGAMFEDALSIEMKNG